MRSNATTPIVLRALSFLLFVGSSLSIADEAATTKKSPGTAVVEGLVRYEADSKRPWRFGRYYIRSAKTGELAESVVCLTGTQLKRLPSPEKPVVQIVDQKDFRFTPETIAIRAGDSIKFTNSDPQLHNVFSRSSLVEFDVSVPNKGEVSQRFDKAGNLRQPVTLGCKLHGNMRAWIFVFDHPYFAITGPDGKFHFDNVPPGEYRLELYHPAGGLRTSRKITVVADRTEQAEITVGPDQISQD